MHTLLSYVEPKWFIADSKQKAHYIAIPCTIIMCYGVYAYKRDNDNQRHVLCNLYIQCSHKLRSVCVCVCSVFSCGAAHNTIDVYIHIHISTTDCTFSLVQDLVVKKMV